MKTPHWVKRLVRDAEVGSERHPAIRANRPEHIEPRVHRVAAGIVPDDRDIALGIRNNRGERLAGGDFRSRAGDLGVIVIIQRNPCPIGNAERSGTGPTMNVVCQLAAKLEERPKKMFAASIGFPNSSVFKMGSAAYT